MAETIDIRELNERIERQSSFVTNLTAGMDQIIVGQKQLHGSYCEILKHRHMRIQIELLEHHGDGLPDDLGLIRMRQLLSIDIDMTTGRLLQEIHASHGGGFTGTGGSDDNQLLAFFYFQIYIFQYLEIPEILTYIFQSDHFAPPFYVPGRNF